MEQQLYLIRHGEYAVPRSDQLTQKGIEQMGAMAKALLPVVDDAIILSSSKTWVLQSSVILRCALGLEEHLVDPHCESAEQLMALLQEYEQRQVLLVSQKPYLLSIARSINPQAPVDMPYGSALRVHLPAGAFQPVYGLTKDT